MNAILCMSALLYLNNAPEMHLNIYVPDMLCLIDWTYAIMCELMLYFSIFFVFSILLYYEYVLLCFCYTKLSFFLFLFTKLSYK